MLFSEMKINDAYTIMTGVAALMYLIAFLMAASVTLFCAKLVVICSCCLYLQVTTDMELFNSSAAANNI